MQATFEMIFLGVLAIVGTRICALPFQLFALCEAQKIKKEKGDALAEDYMRGHHLFVNACSLCVGGIVVLVKLAEIAQH